MAKLWLYVCKIKPRQSKNCHEIHFWPLMTPNELIIEHCKTMQIKWKLVTQAILELLWNTLLLFWWPLMTPNEIIIENCKTMPLSRAGEPLLLLTFFSSGSGSWFFGQAAPAPAPGVCFGAAPAPRGQKNGSWLLVKFGKTFFSLQTSKVKLQKI